MSVIEHGVREEKSSGKTKLVESAGQSHPLGATVVSGGVNFSIYSRDASVVELLLFDRVDDAALRASSPSIQSPTVPTATGTYLSPGGK